MIIEFLSIGYNGAPNGFSDDEFIWSREGSNLETKYPYVCHAELNAILNYRGSKKDLESAKYMLTYFHVMNVQNDYPIRDKRSNIFV